MKTHTVHPTWTLSPVECLDEVLLQAALAVMDQKTHECLGHKVCQVAAHDVKVGAHKETDDFHLRDVRERTLAGVDNTNETEAEGQTGRCRV